MSFAYHMTHLVISIVASDKASKKDKRIFPCSPILLRAIPNTIPNTTNPKVFIPSPYL